MNLPFVSCLCPTWNRFPNHGFLLEETIESFARSTYPLEKRELIILNDTPGQLLFSLTPGVIIVNVPTRFRTLGEKRNTLTALAKGEIFFPWDDDDISLPGRISLSVEKLLEKDGVRYEYPFYGYLNPRNYWFYTPEKKIEVPRSLGYGHNASVYTLEAFRKAGGYPFISVGEDRDLDSLFRKRVAVKDLLESLPYEEWWYIYRWGVSPRHLSGKPGTETHYREIGTERIERGTYRIEPRWRLPYDEMVAAKIAELRKSTPSPLPEEKDLANVL
jgi:hypothetical protein